jgi:hypothetical protein
MPNLKPYLDAAIAADSEVKRILTEMDTLFNNGTDEGKEQALALRPALEKAKSNAESANMLYTSVRDASIVNDKIGALFSSPADPGANSDQTGSNAKVMNRAAFAALDASARMNFMKSGGKLVD